MCDLANFAELFLPSNGQWIDKLLLGLGRTSMVYDEGHCSLGYLFHQAGREYCNKHENSSKNIGSKCSEKSKKGVRYHGIVSLVKFHGKEEFELCPE